MYERRLLVAPEHVVVVADVVVLELEAAAGDGHDGGHAHLADAHLVHHLQLHAGLEDGADALPHLGVELLRESAGAGQTLDQEVSPVLVLVADG